MNPTLPSGAAVSQEQASADSMKKLVRAVIIENYKKGLDEIYYHIKWSSTHELMYNALRHKHITIENFLRDCDNEELLRALESQLCQKYR
mgnify:CR=1 FL=1